MSKDSVEARILALAQPGFAVLVGLFVGAVLIAFSGVNLGLAASTFLKGVAGSRTAVGATLAIFVPLLLTGLSAAFALQAKVLNMGAEGQLYIGALGATIVGLTLRNLPWPILLPLTLLAGFGAGGLYGLIPGYLRAKRGVDELVLTIMLNEIAIQLVAWAVRGPIHEPGPLPVSPEIGQGARLSQLVSGTQIHYGLLLALAAAIAVWFFLGYTTWGFRLRAVGANMTAARFAGMNASNTMIMVMVIAGGLAGLAGAGEVAGVQYRLLDGISPGYGYSGISVALLGKKHPVGVVIAAFLMAALASGTAALQRGVKLPLSLSLLIQAVIILVVVGSEFLSTGSWRLRFPVRRAAGTEAAELRSL